MLRNLDTMLQRLEKTNECINLTAYWRSSLCRKEQDSGVPWSWIHDLLRKRLRIYLYKLHISQALKAHDYTSWMTLLAQWGLQNIQWHASLLSRISYYNWIAFHENNSSNKHEFRIWRTLNHHEQIRVGRESEDYWYEAQCLWIKF